MYAKEHHIKSRIIYLSSAIYTKEPHMAKEPYIKSRTIHT